MPLLLYPERFYLLHCPTTDIREVSVSPRPLPAISLAAAYNLHAANHLRIAFLRKGQRRLLHGVVPSVPRLDLVSFKPEFIFCHRLMNTDVLEFLVFFSEARITKMTPMVAHRLFLRLSTKESRETFVCSPASKCFTVKISDETSSSPTITILRASLSAASKDFFSRKLPSPTSTESPARRSSCASASAAAFCSTPIGATNASSFCSFAAIS